MLVAFILVGGYIVLTNLRRALATNWEPFIPEPTGEEGEFGWSGILRAASIVFFAYIGFEAVSTAGQEAKNPKQGHAVRHHRLAGRSARCIYILVSIVLTLLVNYRDAQRAGSGRGRGRRVRAAMGAGSPRPIKVGAIIGLTSVILVLMYGQTRIFYTMARDGLLPEVFATVHPKFRTPWINTLVVGLIVAVAAGFFDINFLGDMTSVGTLAAFAIVCLTVIWLRRTHPESAARLRVPLYPVLPVARHRLLHLR